MEPYLHFGRVLFVDNWYTGVTLAHKLNEEKTHVVGTLRANRKGNQQFVTTKKLKKGEIVAQT